MSPLLESLLLPALAPAATLYWDADGATAGAGVTPTGINGTSATANTLTALLDTLVFSAGTNATGSLVITVNGTQNAQLLSIEEGAVAFSGGTIALGGGGGITVAAGAGNATVGSGLSLTGAQTFTVGTGRTLAQNTGTFTSATGAVLNVPGAGSVTSTITDLSANNAAGIIGAWATVCTGATTERRYGVAGAGAGVPPPPFTVTCRP